MVRDVPEVAEYLDVLDSAGKNRYFKERRDIVHQQGMWHHTVHLWIITARKRILMQQRSQSKECFPLCWDISCAGHVSSGEEPREALRKECREELGLELNSLTNVKSLGQLATVSQWSKNLDREISSVYLLQVEEDFQPEDYDSEEIAGFRWMPLMELEFAYANRDSAFVMHEEELALLRRAMPN